MTDVPSEKGGTANGAQMPSPLFGAEAFFIFGNPYMHTERRVGYGKGTSKETETRRPEDHQDF